MTLQNQSSFSLSTLWNFYVSISSIDSAHIYEILLRRDVNNPLGTRLVYKEEASTSLYLQASKYHVCTRNIVQLLPHDQKYATDHYRYTPLTVSHGHPARNPGSVRFIFVVAANINHSIFDIYEIYWPPKLDSHRKDSSRKSLCPTFAEEICM
jgi:hypothetical protein